MSFKLQMAALAFTTLAGLALPASATPTTTSETTTFDTTTSGKDANVTTTAGVYWTITQTTKYSLQGSSLAIHNNGKGTFGLTFAIYDWTGAQIAKATVDADPLKESEFKNPIQFGFLTAVDLTPGGTYYAALFDTSGGSGSYQVKADSATIGDGTVVWSVSTTIPTAIANYTQPNNNTSKVPEPTTLALLAPMMAGLAVFRRRKV